MLFPSARRPEDVFTPRSSNVNEAMYVNRKDLEESFSERIRSVSHLVIYGESGCGKSWLYKQFFNTHRIHYKIANLANASRYDSIGKEFLQIVHDEIGPQKKGYEETKAAGANAVLAKADISHKDIYAMPDKDPFLAILQLIHGKAGGGPAFLVLDNLEAIFRQANLMTELADLVTLLDDARYSRYDVRLLIVGVPSGVREYFARIQSRTTVANRLLELREVSRLTSDEANNLILKGFETLLGYTLEDRDLILKHIRWVTDQIPQALHEYCLELAFLAEKAGRKVTTNMVITADKKWLTSSSTAAYTAVENLLNERQTRIGRRNQVLYCLGLTNRGEFKYTDIEAIVRREFPASTEDRNLNIGQVLSELAGEQSGVLKAAPKGDAYMFKDPSYRMCIRAMLRKSGDGSTVEKVDVREFREGRA